MITFHSYEGKTLEIVKENCLKDLNVEESKIYFNEITTEGGLFKGKKIILEAITEDEIINEIKLFIEKQLIFCQNIYTLFID